MGTAGVGGSAIVGSGAFSRVESQRQVKIETVGDEDAYLRLLYNEHILFDCETEQPLLWVTNQLKSTIENISFDVEVVSSNGGDVIVEVTTVPDSLEVGEEGEILADLTCEEDGTVTVNFDIEVDGEDFEVIAHRTDEIEIECSCPEETAWAKVDDPTENRLNEIDGINTNKWGWYMPYEVGDEVTGEFIVGAGNNDPGKGEYVGTVDVTANSDELTVDVEMDEGYTLVGSHLYADETTDRLADINAAPGQFDYDNGDNEYDEEDEAYVIPLEAIGDGVSLGNDVVLALHGEVNGNFDD